MSVDFLAIRRALRTRALTLTVCTTGSTTLAATSTGFTRTTGSFVTDGFVRGLEVTGTGFSAANNAARVVTAVSALKLTVSGLTAQTASSGRTLSVGLPAARSWENIVFDPEPGVPWVEEQLIGGPSTRPGVVAGGVVEIRPEYALHFNTPDNLGAEAADRYADALINLFAPGQDMTLSNGDVLRVRGDTGPARGQLLRRRAGYATMPVTIPLRIYTPQTIS